MYIHGGGDGGGGDGDGDGEAKAEDVQPQIVDDDDLASEMASVAGGDDSDDDEDEGPQQLHVSISQEQLDAHVEPLLTARERQEQKTEVCDRIRPEASVA